MSQQKTIRQLLREEYIRIVKLEVPGYRPGPALEEALDKAEPLCEGKDPVLWVQAQSRYSRINGEFYPKALHFRTAAANYVKYLNASATPEEELFQVQLNYLNTAVTKTGRSDVEVLSDINLDFKPWFRVLMTVEPDDELMLKYGKDAKTVLDSVPKLKTMLEKYKVDLTRLYGKKHNG